MKLGHSCVAYAALWLVCLIPTMVDAMAISTSSMNKTVRPRAVTKITTCRGTGQYPVPVSNTCQPCAYKFSGASACSATAALRCTTGYLSNGACVTVCPASTYYGNGVCTSCSTKYPGSATCTGAAATKCNIGYLSAGKCASNCPTGFVNAANTHTCVPCSRFDSQAATCINGKIATCSAGSFLNTARNACVPCTTVSDFASTCSSATVITTCKSPYSVSSDSRSCLLGSAWSYYLSSSIADIPYDSNVNSPITCARGAVGEGSQVAVFDFGSMTCFSSPVSSTSVVPRMVWDADSAVIVLGTCKTNNALKPAAKARCRDIVLTPSACSLVNKAACSTLLTTCTGSQFRNYNGVCQDCTSMYPSATTCDLTSGATSCVGGNYLSAGVCTSCSTFDENASSCRSDGTLTGCNYGYNLSGNTCIGDNSDPASGTVNPWSYYPDSSVQGLSVLNTNSTDQFVCVEAAFNANYTMATFDPVSNNCFAGMSTDARTSAIASDSNSDSVFVVNSCASNNAHVPSTQQDNCYDVSITNSSCSMGGSTCS